MGFLPIALTLLGFIFLWGIVNYYSIRQRKQEAHEAAEDLFQKADVRRKVLLNLMQSHTSALQDEKNAALISASRISGDQATGTEDKIRQETELSESIRRLLPEIDDQQAAVALQSCHKDFQRALGRYKLRTQEYHELISKYPSKIIARLSGYSSLSS
jgi:hypothetical protein